VKKNVNFKALIMTGFGLLFLYLLLRVSQPLPEEQAFRGAEPPKTLSYAELSKAIDEGRVKEALLRGQRVTLRLKESEAAFFSSVPQGSPVADRLVASGADVRVVSNSDGEDPVSAVLMAFLPPLLMVLLLVWMMKGMKGGLGGMSSVGKSRAKLLQGSSGKVMFSDVAGVEEAKAELVEIVDFLKDPSRFQRLGGRIPKGCLLAGPPGTGKTLLAKAVAGEAGVPFFSISGSDFVEMFVGVGASRVRDMFAEAKAKAPCIVFMDEIDAVGRHRGAGNGGGNDEREQTLNQLLVEMDGFEESSGIIVLAATNRPDILDPALTRPGRFDRLVTVGNPDVLGRERILAVHLRKVPLSEDVDPARLARGTPGFSGADLANVVNEAALCAARRNAAVVSQADFEEAKDKVLMGAERRSMAMSESERRMTAWHEAGHALVAVRIPGNDPLHKVSIVPRGRALGVTVSLPEGDRHGMRKDEILARIAMMFGGRAAEMIEFGEERVSTGASDDIRRATSLARRMVIEWGMSSAVGPLCYGDPAPGEARPAPLSEGCAARIDGEIRRIAEEGAALAERTLRSERKALDAVAEALLERETLSGEEVLVLLDGGSLPPMRHLFPVLDESRPDVASAERRRDDEVASDDDGVPSAAPIIGAEPGAAASSA
jgi:cell division protease FtsH